MSARSVRQPSVRSDIFETDHTRIFLWGVAWPSATSTGFLPIGEVVGVGSGVADHMAAVVVRGEHVSAPADDRIRLRQRPDAVTIAVEAVASAGRLGIRRRHGRRVND